MTRIFVTLSPDETVKLHALGGASWVRLQLLRAECPTQGLRSMYALSQTDREAILADLPKLGRLATAQKHRVKPTTVTVLRRNAGLPGAPRGREPATARAARAERVLS